MMEWILYGSGCAAIDMGGVEAASGPFLLRFIVNLFHLACIYQLDL